jgi:hypothetical protein
LPGKSVKKPVPGLHPRKEGLGVRFQILHTDNSMGYSSAH